LNQGKGNDDLRDVRTMKANIADTGPGCEDPLREAVAMSEHDYISGYPERRLIRVLEEIPSMLPVLYENMVYPPGSYVLDAACGAGIQTCYLARMSSDSSFTGIDTSRSSIIKASKLKKRSKLKNVRFRVGDVFELPFEDATIDHIIFSFGLEYVKNPERALKELKRVLRPGGTITVISGDLGSCIFWPETSDSLELWEAMQRAHEFLGGDSSAGRKIYPILHQTGFRFIHVTPATVYIDANDQELREGFLRRTLIPMVQEMKPRMLALSLINETSCECGVQDFIATSESLGTFAVTFFRGTGIK
jgi:ubiquinone/menaquinone biosynthesis C-methylase UbiE